MKFKKCIVCGSDRHVTWNLCPACVGAMKDHGEKIAEGIFKNLPVEHSEILKAMFEKQPVEYEGNEYGCISAFTVRTRVSRLIKLKNPYILQVELMGAHKSSVVIADPEKIKILWRRPKE